MDVVFTSTPGCSPLKSCDLQDIGDRPIPTLGHDTFFAALVMLIVNLIARQIFPNRVTLMMPGFATKTFNGTFQWGGTQNMPASLSLCRLFTARRKRFVALIAAAALLASSIVTRVPLNIQSCQDMARVAIGQSVMCAFFYHSSLPLLIISKYIKDARVNTSSHHRSDNKKETPSNASSGCVLVAPAQTLLKVKTLSYCGGSHPYVPILVRHQADSLYHISAAPLYRDGLVTALILLFFFLLPRSSIGGDYIMRIINRSTSRFVTIRTGFFYFLQFVEVDIFA